MSHVDLPAPIRESQKNVDSNIARSREKEKSQSTKWPPKFLLISASGPRSRAAFGA